MSLDYRAVHESAHCVIASLTGAGIVHSATIGAHGGMTALAFDGRAGLRAVVLTLLAGLEGEELLVGTADPRGSIVDLTNAYRIALEIAADEEHAATPKTAGRAMRFPPEPAMAAARLETLPAADVRAGVSRLVARRTARAEVLVQEARAEVRTLLSRSLCVVRVLAAALEGFQHLDEQHVAALLAEGRRRQTKDDARFGVRRTA